MEKVTARVEQLARAERLGHSLLSRLIEAGASREEAHGGLLAALISSSAADAQPAQIEWLRDMLDLSEQRMFDREGVHWRT